LNIVVESSKTIVLDFDRGAEANAERIPGAAVIKVVTNPALLWKALPWRLMESG